MPTISVIVPVYKVEPYLNRCVDSILRQTYQDFELILVDDGSPDRCGEICDEYARQDGRVLTLDVPAEVATFRTTIEDMQALQSNGVKTLVLVTEKNTTTLNLSLLCEGQKSGTRVTLRHLGSSATLSVGLRCRRDLLIGR